MVLTVIACVTALLAGAGVSVWSWSGLSAIEPEARERDGGIELVLPRGRRRRYAAGILLVTLATVLAAALIRASPGDRPTRWTLLAGAAVVFAAFAAAVWRGGTGRLLLTPEGLVSRPVLGRTRRIAWDRIEGVAAGRGRVLVVDDEGRRTWVNEVPGWGAERTEEVLDRLARGRGRDRLSDLL